MTVRLLDVRLPVLTRKGEPYLEEGRRLMIGDVFCAALDTPRQDLAPAERRARFWLSCRIEESMRRKDVLEIDLEDYRRLEAVAEACWINHMFAARMIEALMDTKEVELLRTGT